MDIGKIITKLESRIPGVVLESRPFGQAAIPAIWVETRYMVAVAEILSKETEDLFDWLENLSVMEIDGALVLTYFLRSHTTGGQILLRASVVPGGAREEAFAFSVSRVWPMGAAMEREVGELFGIRFEGATFKKNTRRILPGDWSGYPLRKAYVFPKEYSGTAHGRRDPGGRQ